jgi:thiamine biosynthesis lipoprotein
MYKRTENLMGTFVGVGVDRCTDTEADAAIRRAFAEMRKTAALLNYYDSDSEIGRLNAERVLRHASADTLTVMRMALYFSILSDGAFDVSVLPIIRLWEHGARTGVPPSAHEISAAVASVGYKNILIEDDSVHLLHSNMRISLAGIAKGFVVDRGISVLRACGVTRAVIDGGGDIRVMCEQTGPPWRIGIRDPFHRKNILHVLEAHNLAVASGGAYAHTYNDIIDPRTGAQIQGVGGVSVAAEETVTADALATCLSVLGPEVGISLAEQQKTGRVAALFVSDSGTQHSTANWTGFRV